MRGLRPRDCYDCRCVICSSMSFQCGDCKAADDRTFAAAKANHCSAAKAERAREKKKVVRKSNSDLPDSSSDEGDGDVELFSEDCVGARVFLCSTHSTLYTCKGTVIKCTKVMKLGKATMHYDVRKDVGGVLYNVPGPFVYSLIQSEAGMETAAVQGPAEYKFNVGSAVLGWRGFSGLCPQPQMAEVTGAGVVVSVAIDCFGHPCFYEIKLEKGTKLEDLFWFDALNCLSGPLSAQPLALRHLVANHARYRARTAAGKDAETQLVPMGDQIMKMRKHLAMPAPPGDGTPPVAATGGTAAAPAPSATAAAPSDQARPPAAATAGAAAAPALSATKHARPPAIGESGDAPYSSAAAPAGDASTPPNSPPAAATASSTAAALSRVAAPSSNAPPPAASAPASDARKRTCKDCKEPFPWQARVTLCPNCDVKEIVYREPGGSGGGDDDDGADGGYVSTSASSSGSDRVPAGTKRGRQFRPGEKELLPIMYIIACDSPYTHQRNSQKVAWTNALKHCHKKKIAVAATAYRQLRCWCDKVCEAHYKLAMYKVRASGNAEDVPKATIIDTVSQDWADYQLRCGKLSVINKEHAQIIRTACTTTSMTVQELSNVIAKARTKHDAVARTKAKNAPADASASFSPTSNAPSSGSARGNVAITRTNLQTALAELNKPLDLSAFFASAQAPAPPGLAEFAAALVELERRTFPGDMARGGPKLEAHAATIMLRLGIETVAELALCPAGSESQVGLAVLPQLRLKGVMDAQRILSDD